MVHPQELQGNQWVMTPEVKLHDLSLMSSQDTHRKNCSTKQSSHLHTHACPPDSQTDNSQL